MWGPAAGYVALPFVAAWVGPALMLACVGGVLEGLGDLNEVAGDGLFMHALLLPCLVVHAVLTAVASRDGRVTRWMLWGSVLGVLVGLTWIHAQMAVEICRVGRVPSTIGLVLLLASASPIPQGLFVALARYVTPGDAGLASHATGVGEGRDDGGALR